MGQIRQVRQVKRLSLIGENCVKYGCETEVRANQVAEVSVVSKG